MTMKPYIVHEKMLDATVSSEPSAAYCSTVLTAVDVWCSGEEHSRHDRSLDGDAQAGHHPHALPHHSVATHSDVSLDLHFPFRLRDRLRMVTAHC